MIIDNIRHFMILKKSQGAERGSSSDLRKYITATAICIDVSNHFFFRIIR